MSTRFGFIGAGNIVSAILNGVSLSGKAEPSEIAIYDLSMEVRAKYQEKGYTVHSSITALVEDSPVVVIALKPQVMPEAMPEVKAAMSPSKVLVSVAAGISTDWLAERSGTDKVIRSMPNTPAQAGFGAIAVARGAGVNDNEFAAVQRFLGYCGIVEEIPESLMCEVTAISGSSPAFFYRIAHVMIKEAVKMGFSEGTALRLLTQSMRGSAEMLLNSGISAETLEKNVCSPKGTTLAALEKMDELGFNGCLTEGMRACAKRCHELSG